MDSWLARTGIRLSDWFERWFPDAFTLALAAVMLVFLACLGQGASPLQAAEWFGAGFWDLMKFTLQMAMVLVAGYTALQFAVHAPLVLLLVWALNATLR